MGLRSDELVIYPDLHSKNPEMVMERSSYRRRPWIAHDQAGDEKPGEVSPEFVTLAVSTTAKELGTWCEL